MEGKQGENQSDGAHDAWRDRSRVGEFHVKQDDSERAQKKGDVRVDDVKKKALARCHRVGLERGVPKPQGAGGAVKPLDRLAVELRKDILRRVGDEVDQAPLQGFLFRERPALTHAFLGQLRIAPAPVGDTADVSRGVVLDLRLHSLADLIAPEDHGVRRPRVGPGRHRGYVAGNENKESGGGGPGPARRHVRDHRHARLDDRLDDLAHGGLKTAWRINLDQHRLGIDLVGVADTAHHKFGAHRFDHFPQVHLNDSGWDGGLIRMRAGGQKAASVRQ